MQQTVLGVLLAQPRRPHRTDELADRVWAGSPPRTAAAALRVYVDQLRRAMRAEPLIRLVTSPQGYQIVPEDGELDAHRFDRALRRGLMLAKTDPEQASIQLRWALSEWRGQPFRGLDEIEEIQSLRAYYEDRLLQLQLALAEIELDLGRHALLLPDLTLWCEARPENEGLARSLALAQYRSGDHLGALSSCRRFQHLMRREFGLDVSTEFSQLEQDLLRRAPELDHGSAESAVERPLPPRSREREIRAVLSLLPDGGEQRVVAIRGEPGSGKSWLLHELAHLVHGAALLISNSPLTAVEQLEAAVGPEIRSPEPATTSPSANGRPLPPRRRAAVLDDTLVQRGITVVLIDDLDRLDADSLAVLSNLADFEGSNLRWVITQAPGPPPVGLERSSLTRPTETVDLPSLDLADIAHIFREHGELQIAEDQASLEQIRERTGGNAYVVATLARHRASGGSEQQLPRQIGDHVRRAGAALDSRVLFALQLASLEDGSWPISAAVLRVASDTPAEILISGFEDAIGLGLLVDRPEGPSFRHGFVAEAMIASWSTTRRRDGHLRLAAALRELGSADVARIARHLREGDDPSARLEAARFTAAEANLLADSGAVLAAIARLREALALGAMSGEREDVIDWQLRLAELLNLVGQVDQASEHATAAAQLAVELHSASLFSEAAIHAVGPWLPTGAQRETARSLTTAALRWSSGAAGVPRVRLAEAAARALSTSIDSAGVRASIADLVAELSVDVKGGDVQTRLLASLGMRTLSWRQGWKPADRARFTRDAAALARTAGETTTRLELERMFATDALEAGDLTMLEQGLTWYSTDARQAGETVHLWWSHQLTTTRSQLRGDQLAGGAEMSTRLSRHVDPGIVRLCELERRLSELYRRGQFEVLLAALEQLGSIEGASEATFRLATLAASVRTGRAVDGFELEDLVHGLQAGPFTSTDAALAVVAASGLTDPSALAGELRDILAVNSGGMCVLSGASVLGAVDTYLARASLLAGDRSRAEALAAGGCRQTRSFAPIWSNVAATWDREEWP